MTTARSGDLDIASHNGGKSHKELAKQADRLLFDALEICGFHRNIWSFDPWFVRIIFRTLAYTFSIISIYSWSHIGTYRWTFTTFSVVLCALNLFWFYYVECKGGLLIFSNDWRDSFVRTEITATNYVIHIHVGYKEHVVISIPFASFEKEGVSLEWLANEIFQALPKHLVTT